MKELSGKVAVVTGGASGIGRALAQRLGAEGMRVVIADVEQEALSGALRELTGAGVDARAVRCDVSSQDSVTALAEKTQGAFGKVHVLCNNAGVFAGGLTWEAPLSDFEWVLGVNVYGVLHGIRAFVPIFLKQGEPAHVINTVSMAGFTYGPASSAYFMSKHAALALSESLYLELKNRGAPVGVTAVCPELVATRIGHAERNRPPHLKRGDVAASPERDLVENAIKTATASGLSPDAIAERAITAMKEDRFYALAPEGDAWRRMCNARLELVRTASNPQMLF
jgi:NAD(P)-dependent dehydrogenase (short-subunit alcohol dehydrogenase family)